MRADILYARWCQPDKFAGLDLILPAGLFYKRASRLQAKLGPLMVWPVWTLVAELMATDMITADSVRRHYPASESQLGYKASNSQEIGFIVVKTP